MKPFDTELFNKFSNESGLILACDEVGRGPLAGDVVSACVVINTKCFNPSFFSDLNIDDSKKLSAKKRVQIIQKLNIKWNFKKKTFIAFSSELQGIQILVSRVSPKEIDKINILQASLKSMANCVNAIESKTIQNNRVHLLIDGNQSLGVRISHLIIQEALVKGDSKSVFIGLASIIAKEFRDSLMKRYDKQYPQFHFGKNSGYPTKAHKEAIAQYGILDIHRKTFKGVKEFCSQKATKV